MVRMKVRKGSKIEKDLKDVQMRQAAEVILHKEAVPKGSKWKY
jgi:hypothetical protein